MNRDQSDTTITDLHRIRREMAARFRGDLFALTADAQARTEAAGRKVVQRRPSASQAALNPSGVPYLPRIDAPSSPGAAGQNVESS